MFSRSTSYEHVCENSYNPINKIITAEAETKSEKYQLIELIYPQEANHNLNPQTHLIKSRSNATNMHALP